MFLYTEPLPNHILTQNKDDYSFQTKEESKYFKEHVHKSKQFFKEYTNSIRGNALIIGPGHMRDLPRKHIAQQFSELTFIDIDDHGIKQWQKEFPQKKTNVWIEDFTQIQGNIIREVDSIKALSLSDLLLKIAEVYNRHSSQKFSDNLPQTTYDFISAAVILSQVNTNLQHHYFSIIGQTTLEHIFHEGTTLEQMALKTLESSYEKLALKIQIDLISWMHSRLNKDGTLLLTMTPLVYQDQYTPNSTSLEYSEKAVLIDLVSLQNELPKYFVSIDKPSIWKWNLTPPSQENNWIHRYFKVQARILKKR